MYVSAISGLLPHTQPSPLISSVYQNAQLPFPHPHHVHETSSSFLRWRLQLLLLQSPMPTSILPQLRSAVKPPTTLSIPFSGTTNQRLPSVAWMPIPLFSQLTGIHAVQDNFDLVNDYSRLIEGATTLRSTSEMPTFMQGPNTSYLQSDVCGTGLGHNDRAGSATNVNVTERARLLRCCSEGFDLSKLYISVCPNLIYASRPIELYSPSFFQAILNR